MRHIVDIRGNEAICACGRRAVRASQQEAIDWASQHGREFAATELSTPDSPPRDALPGSVLYDATDDQLRAALQERGYVTAKTNENNDWRGAFEVQRDHNFELARERDEWRLRAEADEADMMKLGWAPPLKSERWEALVRECAEWQRRAESAIDPEALRKWGLNPDAVREYESHADAMRAMGFERDVGIWRARAEAAEAKLVLFEAGNAFAGRQMTVDEDALRKLRANLRERGPGIAATKPDNSVAFLDEDLLCEDT